MIACSKFFSCPFSSWSFHSFYLLPFIFFLAAVIRWVLILGKAFDLGGQSIIGIMGHFTTIFAPKLKTFFNLQCQNAVDIENQLLCR